MAPTTGVSASSVGDGSDVAERHKFDYVIRAQLLVLAGHDPALTRAALAVLANLVGRANRESGLAWPRHSRIAKETKIARRTVVKEIGRLRSLGWIRLVKSEHGRVSTYELGQMGPHQRSLVTGFDPGLISVTCDSQITGGVTPTSQEGVTATSHRTKGRRTKGKNQEPLAQSSPAAHGIAVPAWVPSEPWHAFIQARREGGKPVTPTMAEKLIEHLERLRADGNEPGAVLDQSTRNAWTGLFPIKSAQPAPRDDGAPPRRQEFKI